MSPELLIEDWIVGAATDQPQAPELKAYTEAEWGEQERFRHAIAPLLVSYPSNDLPDAAMEVICTAPSPALIDQLSNLLTPKILSEVELQDVFRKSAVRASKYVGENPRGIFTPVIQVEPSGSPLRLIVNITSPDKSTLKLGDLTLNLENTNLKNVDLEKVVVTNTKADSCVFRMPP
ncbi:hypothetical protein M501DRAFT_1018172 [Patellaria atrata CBS 101060]|uniref:Uncharacterized protein n=1 Tax=Patellaria atrata CBS 101060 TaxID=1346257 RepID=A0A9P4S6X4_9PEZI|nr:hypothetical protein M501DRAFT_1018172 [Patellaria atrata CBS 101060]